MRKEGGWEQYHSIGLPLSYNRRNFQKNLYRPHPVRGIKPLSESCSIICKQLLIPNIGWIIGSIIFTSTTFQIENYTVQCTLTAERDYTIIYREYQAFSPIVWYQMGGQHWLVGEGLGGVNSDDWRESLALCLLLCCAVSQVVLFLFVSCIFSGPSPTFEITLM